MDEEYITRIANGLFDEAYMAKRYLLTMEQMRSCTTAPSRAKATDRTEVEVSSSKMLAIRVSAGGNP